jgi:hypothetical protein
METNVHWSKINSPAYNMFQSNIQIDNTITLYIYIYIQIKSRIAMAKLAFSKEILFTSKLDLDLRKKLVKKLKCYIWSIALYGAETWTLRKVDQKYL